MFKKTRFTLQTKTIFLVFFTTLVFILTAGTITSYKVAQNQKQIIKEEINSVSKIVANNEQVQIALRKKSNPQHITRSKNMPNKLKRN
ncbi:hypothetical protein SDC49_07040 [Lactobacillus sp. R2/2]|nr:hypothetical protein [Lactobacillus sp. R2/2]